MPLTQSCSLELKVEVNMLILNATTTVVSGHFLLTETHFVRNVLFLVSLARLQYQELDFCLFASSGSPDDQIYIGIVRTSSEILTLQVANDSIFSCRATSL